jgi:hypothetical protein
MVWMAVNVMYLIVALIFDARSSRDYKEFKANQIERYSFSSYVGIIRRGK